MGAMNESLKALHDQMLEAMPENAKHVEAECPFCTPQTSNDNGGRMSDTFTKDQVDALVQAAVAEATASLRTELDEFKTGQEAAAVDAKIADVKAEADTKVADLQAQLDAKVIEAQEATKAHDDLVAHLNSEKEAAEAAAALETLTEERKTAVAEVVEFPEDYVEAQAARWAGMSEEDFESTLADYKEVASRAAASRDDAGKGGDKGAPETKLGTGSRETASDKSGFTALAGLSELRRSGVDPRELIR